MDAIIGFGLAGSTLAARLADRDLLLIDPVAPEDDPRTFGCWALGPHPMDSVAYRSWSRLAVITDRTTVVELAPYRYLAFRMADWRAQVARSLTRASIVRGVVHEVADTPYGARMDLGGEQVHARWVFDSRFSPSGLAPVPGEVQLWQSFRGARIQADHDVFDPDLPVLLDFRGPGDGVVFGYVLPESPRVALVERVRIAARPHPVDLDGWLSQALGLRRWSVLAQEGGATPMTDRRFRRRTGNRMLATGTAGGRLKPSTGYGVGRMLRDAEAVARSLSAHGHPFAIPEDPVGFRWLDTVFLRVLRDRPDLAAEVFGRLFAGNPGPRVLRFLDEAASAREVVALAATLPIGPFLRAALGFRPGPARGSR